MTRPQSVRISANQTIAKRNRHAKAVFPQYPQRWGACRTFRRAPHSTPAFAHPPPALWLRFGEWGGCFVAFENLKDESLLRFYNNIRDQFEADRGSKHKFTNGPSVKQHASALRDEMVKRRLQHTAIEWDRN
jgi:hypothetical protein